MANYLTQQDVDNYGDDLVEFTQRAAAHAMAPHLEALQAQNAHLRNQVARETRHRLEQQLDQALPDWRRIDQDPRWRTWLSQYDVLSGQVRQRMLDEAAAEGNAARVMHFFRGFLSENGSTSASHAYAGARQGAAKTGQKPTYTRAQIGKLYERRRRGAFRDQDWARVEADIFAAGREGRIIGGVDPRGY